MQLRQGWSGEVAPGRWAKFDITLEEEDLFRLIANAFGEDFDTDRLLDEIPVSQAYQILEIEAEILVLSKLVVRYGMSGDQAVPQIDALRKQQNAILGQLRDGVVRVD